jgi:hypothetical protein
LIDPKASHQCQTTVITAGCSIRLFSLISQPNTFRIYLLQLTLPVARPIDSFESHFTDEVSVYPPLDDLSTNFQAKNELLSEDFFSLGLNFGNRGFFNPFLSLNQHKNELLTVALVVGELRKQAFWFNSGSSEMRIRGSG